MVGKRPNINSERCEPHIQSSRKAVIAALLATMQNCLSEECCVLSDKIMFLCLPLRRPMPTHGCRADDDDDDDDIYHYNPALWFERHLSCYIRERHILNLDIHLCNRVCRS